MSAPTILRSARATASSTTDERSFVITAADEAAAQAVIKFLPNRRGQAAEAPAQQQPATVDNDPDALAAAAIIAYLPRRRPAP